MLKDCRYVCTWARSSRRLSCFPRRSFRPIVRTMKPVERDGIRGGALTALLGMGLIIAMFALVDNIFLDTVSQQVDKIRGFEQSHDVSMRSYINWSLLEGAIFVVPVLGVVGAASGGFGGLLAARIYAPKTNS